MQQVERQTKKEVSHLDKLTKIKWYANINSFHFYCVLSSLGKTEPYKTHTALPANLPSKPTIPRNPRGRSGSSSSWVQSGSLHGLLGFVVLQCPSGDVVPFPQSAGRGGAGDQSSAGCSGAKMAARRGRRDRVAPPPTGGPGPDPGGGVRGGGWASRSQAPHGTVGSVSPAEQVRG